METTFICKIQIVSMCYNPLNNTAFLLKIDNDYNNISSICSLNSGPLSLTEEDIYNNITVKRFKLLQKHECNITNTNYRHLPDGTYEGYSLYFWELTSKLFVVYPFGYILIYDINSSSLIAHFQCHGQKTYVIRNIIGSPMENCFFISAENMHNIYMIDFAALMGGNNNNNYIGNSNNNNGNNNINNNVSNKVYYKLVLPNNIRVFDVLAHPNEKFLYVACGDGIIRVFDYSKKGSKGRDIWISEFSKEELARKSPDLSISSLDLSSDGSLLLSVSEKGSLILWDAMAAIKGRVRVLARSDTEGDPKISVKFLLFRSMTARRVAVMGRRGKIEIFFVGEKGDGNNKEYSLSLVYENSAFSQITFPLLKYNTIFSNFLQVNSCENTIAAIWPEYRVEKIRQKDSKFSEDYLIFTGFNAKIFFLYDNSFPKIGMPMSTQMEYGNYDKYIPKDGVNQNIFESKIYFADNYLIYQYDIVNGTTKKMINYSKELGQKNLLLLKFDVKESINNEIIYFILVETEFNNINLIIIYTSPSSKPGVSVYPNIIDFLILGNKENFNSKNDFVFIISKDLQNGYLYRISSKNLVKTEIDSSVVRMYKTPFCEGYTVLYRNVLNELRFSENYENNMEKFEIKQNPYDTSNIKKNNEENDNEINTNIISPKFNLKSSKNSSYKLDFNEREIDIIYTKHDNSYIFCISMIDKIVILDEKLKILGNLRTNFGLNLTIINSTFFVGNNLIFSNGNEIYYYYYADDIKQKIFTSNRNNVFISGILPDRFILTSMQSSEGAGALISTPALEILEPIFIGFIDELYNNHYKDTNVNDINNENNILDKVALAKTGFSNMFSNQFSNEFIDKLVKKGMVEVAWLLISDSDSAYENPHKKIEILNDMLEFEKILENIFPENTLKNELNLDDIIWKIKYDQGFERCKKILIYEVNLLVKYGQFDIAIKILELLGKYYYALNLLFLSTTPEEFEKIRVNFQAKKSLDFTENLYINNAFISEENNKNYNNNKKSSNDDKNSYEKYNMSHYNKIYDKYEGEHFTFGANQGKLHVEHIEDLKSKISRKNGIITNISKKIVPFGETAYTLYSKIFENISNNTENDNNNNINNTDKQVKIQEICSLVVQKIEHYFGINNTVLNSKNNNNKNNTNKQGFIDYNIPLDMLGSNKVNNIYNNTINDNFDTNNKDSNANPSVSQTSSPIEEDFDSNVNIDEIAETDYLSLYFHCDQGSGEFVEDVSDNGNNGKMVYEIENKNTDNKGVGEENKLAVQNLTEQLSSLQQIPLWGEALDEFAPLEYEDKWGRKSPCARPLRFSKDNKVRLIIDGNWGNGNGNGGSVNNNGMNGNENNYNGKDVVMNGNRGFTVEMWVLLKSMNVTIFEKDTFKLMVVNGKFSLYFDNKEQNATLINEYKLNIGKFFHLAVSYSRKKEEANVMLNCEDIIKYISINLSTLPSSSPLLFGAGDLDGELTEIRVWNKKMPKEYIRENHASPLPILAENKKRVRMRINRINSGRKNIGGLNGMNNNPGNGENNGMRKKIDFKNIQFGLANREGANPSTQTSFPTENSNMPINPFGSEEELDRMNYPSFNAVNEDKNDFDFDNNNVFDNEEKKKNNNEDKNNGFQFRMDDFNFD